MGIKLFIKENKLFLLLLGIFIVSEIIVNPIADFPLNDDWTYSKSELILHKDGKVDIGDFPAMTLFIHLVWGTLFTKIFGFSFTVLRFSTIVSSLVGLFFLNKLILDITNNKITAFIVCLALLFNPLYFNLTNTYMTDVNFNTLIIMCCYFAQDFFKRKGIFSFMMVFVSSILLVLIRQFGVIVPVCFAFSCLFLPHQKWKFSALAIICGIVVFLVFKYFENYLKGVLEPHASYIFSDKVSITQRVFWDTTLIRLIQRHTTVLLHVLLYGFPLIVIFIKDLYKEFKILTLVFISFIALVTVYHVFNEAYFPMGNIFVNTNLGAETFFETLHPQFRSKHEHTWSEQAERIINAVKYGFIFVNVVCITLMLLKLVKLKQSPFLKRPIVIFLACLFFLYGFSLFIPESYTDRYHLPLVTITLIFLSFANNYIKINARSAWLPLLLLFYVSVLGTRDYFELNRKRWEAYNFIKNDMRVNHKKINGGFEINCWNEGEKCIWYDFLDLKKYSFLIQYRQEKGFIAVKTYTFQRYLPYTKDKIFIFANLNPESK